MTDPTVALMNDLRGHDAVVEVHHKRSVESDARYLSVLTTPAGPRWHDLHDAHDFEIRSVWTRPDRFDDDGERLIDVAIWTDDQVEVRNG